MDKCVFRSRGLIYHARLRSSVRMPRLCPVTERVSCGCQRTVFSHGAGRSLRQVQPWIVAVNLHEYPLCHLRHRLLVPLWPRLIISAGLLAPSHVSALLPPMSFSGTVGNGTLVALQVVAFFMGGLPGQPAMLMPPIFLRQAGLMTKAQQHTWFLCAPVILSLVASLMKVSIREYMHTCLCV